MFVLLGVLVRELFFLVLGLGYLSVSKPGLFLSVLQSYWSVHVWNRKGAAFLSSVSRYLGVLGEFLSDLEYFALLSFVGCIGTFLVSVVLGRTRLPSLLRLLGASSARGRSTPLTDHYLRVNRRVRRLRGHSNHENAEVFF